MIDLNSPVFTQFNLTSAPSLHPDIDLYFCPLSTLHLYDNCIVFLQTLLTPVELKERYAYRTDTLKTNAILSRGLLRLILAEYLTEIHPKDIELMQQSLGKLYLPNSTLKFSVSHSNSMLIFAVSQTYLIGIDIESKDQKIQEDLVDFVLSYKELSIYYQLTQAAKPTYFLQCWTRKEAYLKTIGTGLVNHLNLIDTSDDYVVDQGRVTPYQASTIEIDQHHIVSLVYA